MKGFILAVLFLSGGISIFAAESAMRLNPLVIDPYRHILVQELYGMRDATAINAETVVATLGVSLSGNYEDPKSWLIESETDPNYCAGNDVAPLAVETKSVVELMAFPDSLLPEFRRHAVTLALPHPLKSGHRYSVTAQGSEFVPITFGRMSASFFYPSAPSAGTETKEKQRMEEALSMRILGLRGAASIGNGIVALEFGPAIDSERILDAEKYRFRLNGKTATPAMIAKRQVVECFLSTEPYEPILRTDLFFRFPEPLQDGDRLSVVVDSSIVAGASSARLDFQSDETVSPSFVLPRFRFNANERSKLVFVSYWLSVLPANMGGVMQMPPLLPDSEAYALFLPEDLPFEVRRSDGRKMLGGTLKNVPNPSALPGIALFQIPGVQAYEANLSQIRRTGRFFVSVTGVGRSLPFDIAADGWQAPGVPQSAAFESGGMRQIEALEGPSITSRRLFLQYGIMEPDDLFPADGADD